MGDEDFKANWHDVPFDRGVARELSGAFRRAASSIEEQTSARSIGVERAGQDFQGLFAELFAANAQIAATDARTVVMRLREAREGVVQLMRAAQEEQDRREEGREWQRYMDSRRGNIKAFFEDAFGGARDAPLSTPSPEPRIEAAQPQLGERQTPASGSGSSHGVSSARPADLLSFADGTGVLNDQLRSVPSQLRSLLNDFQSRCQWGQLDASGVVVGCERWIAANDADTVWARTIADAFIAAGGRANISRVSNAGLLRVLAAAGVGASRESVEIAPAQAFGAPPTSGYANDPVNTGTGNFLETEVDLGFGGGCAGLEMARTYNSLDANVGVFGVGWSSWCEVRLELSDEGAVFVMPDGRQQIFPRQGKGWDRAVGENSWLRAEPLGAPGTSTPPRGEDAELVQEPGESTEGTVLVVSNNAGARWVFSAAGVWLFSETGPGTRVRVSRDEVGRVSRLTHEHGRWVSVEYLQQRVVVVAASDGRRVEFGYDAEGHLVTAAGPGGTRRYRWNEAGLIAEVEAASGVIEAKNTYDALRRVSTQVSAFGRVTRFVYLPGRLSIVSDEDGTRSNTWISDSSGRLVGVVDAHDERQSMSYDSHGNLVMATDRSGGATVHAYDERGRRIRTLTPAGADLSVGYDEHDRVRTVVGESGAVVQYEYAEPEPALPGTLVRVPRNPSVIIDASGGRTELLWENSLLVEITDPVGVRVRLAYDGHGDLIAVTNAVGDTARLLRDEAGRVSTAISPGGARTEYRYSAAGHLASRRDADGGLWRYDYAAGGALVQVTDPLGATTQMTYGSHGAVAGTVDELGREHQRSFDDAGNLSAVTLPGGAVWGFAHDELARLTRITDPGGGLWEQEYGKNGDLAAMVDPTGVRQIFSTDTVSGESRVENLTEWMSVKTDEYGRPVESAGADGCSELLTYDACGRPVELVDGEGSLTVLRRDLAGRIIEQIDPLGESTHLSYDACGRAESIVDSRGIRVSVTYDADSRVITRTVSGTGGDGETEHIEYDACGRVRSRRTPGRGSTRYDYDLRGRVLRCVDPWYGRRKFRYDAAGQVIETVNGLGGITRYDYDVRGRVSAVTDPIGGVYRYEYNEGDQVVAVRDPLGRVSRAGYDLAGRALWREDPDGLRLDLTYDVVGAPQSVSVAGNTLLSVTRDVRERRVMIADFTRGDGESVEHVLGYNRRGQLTSHQRGQDTVGWEYDAAGNRSAQVDPSGHRTEYFRDRAGALSRISHPVCGEVRYGYDADGRMSESVSAGLRQSWTYEHGAPSTHTMTGLQGVTQTHIHRDEDGRIAAITTSEGRTAYGYDAAGQLTSAVHSSGEVQRWSFDLAGRMSAESHTDSHGVTRTTALEYDVAGQLLSRTEGGEVTRYRYDSSGRRTHVLYPDNAETGYQWSPLGSVAEVRESSASGAVNRSVLWVDALGELAAIMTPGAAPTDARGAGSGRGGSPDGAEFALWWDTASGVPAVVQAGDRPVSVVPGGLAAIGDHLIAAGWRGTQATNPSSPWQVEPGMSGAAAALPAGVGMTATGGVQIAGLDWFGARMYDSGAKGFLSTDPLPPVPGAGWAGNPYSFAGNDPLHAVDPWGLSPVSDADIRKYNEGNNGVFAAAGDWVSKNWEYVAGGAMIVAGIAGLVLMATGVGAPLGIALAVGSGAALMGGASAIEQKSGKGSVDWGEVGIQAALGGASGALGGGSAALLGRAASPLMKLLGEGVGKTAVNTVAGAGANGAVYTVEKLVTGGAWDAREFGGSLVGGGLGGVLGGFAPKLGTLVGKGPMVSKLTTAVAGAGAGATGAAANELVSGHEVNATEIMAGSAGGLTGAVVHTPHFLLSKTPRHAAPAPERAFGEQSLRSVSQGNSWAKAGFESTLGTVAESVVKGFGNSISTEGK